MRNAESQRSGLNRRPLDYESSALPLSYAGNAGPIEECPGTDSNRDALRHHPLKMACLPISPPGLIQEYNCGHDCGHYYGHDCDAALTTGPTGVEPATSRVTVECSNQLSYGP